MFMKSFWCRFQDNKYLKVEVRHFVATNPQYEFLEQLSVDLLDNKCIRFLLLEMIDDHLTSCMIARQLNCHMLMLHFLNHFRHNEAAGEKVVARRPVGKDILVGFYFDRIEEIG